MAISVNMGKKLLIDLVRLRDYKNIPVEGIWKQDAFIKTFKSIREIATFMFTCRKCENAPCIEACPAEALEKDKHGMIKRSLYRCIRCKSCVVICPFGTIMDNLFEVKTSGREFISLTRENDLQKFVESFPDGIITLVDGEENPAENIYRLDNHLLIKEQRWQ